MNRNYFFLFILLFFLFFQIPFIKIKIIEIANFIKTEVSNIKEGIKNKIYLLESKEELIKSLKEENNNLKIKVANLESKLNLCKDLKDFKQLNFPNLVFVKAISYAALPDFTQIYINYNKSFLIPRGLIYNNIAAGIAVKNLGAYSLAYLVSNPKVSFTVIVGKKEIPGIFEGKTFRVKYLKKFEKINVGDIVKTSGLDNIFYKGVLVGRVKKVIQKKLYQEVVIDPFYKKLTPTYFYLVEKNVTISKN